MTSQLDIYGLSIAVAILLIGIGWFIWHHLNKTRHQRKIHKVLGSLGAKYLHDIILPDGIEGFTHIDYLLLAPNGVVVLDINFSEGHLFGGESIDQWTQVVNNKTYKFNNPLFYNQTKCQAVLWNVENNLPEGTKVDDSWKAYGWVAFSSTGNFPKGIPDHVCMIEDLKSRFEQELNFSAPINEASRDIWDKLHDLSIATRKEMERQ